MLLAIALFAILLCTLNAFGVMALSATTVQVLLLAAMVVIIVALWAGDGPGRSNLLRSPVSPIAARLQHAGPGPPGKRRQ